MQILQRGGVIRSWMKWYIQKKRHRVDNINIIELKQISFRHNWKYRLPKEKMIIQCCSRIFYLSCYYHVPSSPNLNGIPLLLLLFLLEALLLFHFSLSWQTLLPSPQLLKQEIILYSFLCIPHPHLSLSPSDSHHLDSDTSLFVLLPASSVALFANINLFSTKLSEASF